MHQKREQLQQQTRALLATDQARRAEVQADSLAERAGELQTEQASLPESVQVDASYRGALAMQIEAKHGQAERIEDRLESLIERQASKLQQSQSQQPGLIALPGTRARWQQHLQQQQSTMQRLQGRLETVREIKDGMGVHGPRVEELATRKLRRADPAMAAEWDELQEAQRLNQAHQRRLQKDKEQKAQQGTGAGMAHVLAISQRAI